ncbi:MAG: polyprenyl synthetase family protein [Planctomycetota bacterium]|jgi:geranylgeranyl diphosphate synthase type II
MLQVRWNPLALKTILEETRQQVDARLEQYLQAPDGFGSKLHEAMRYAVFSGGKRLRPVLCLWVNDCLGGSQEEILPAACALEMIHTYSLIHDDLPAMDNDDFRRGRPSCHKAFDEATAILAGDGLLTQAFEVVAKHTPSTDLVPGLVRALSEAAGPEGMVLGQMRDLEAEGRDPEIEMVKAIHEKKTAAMIIAAFKMGALSARAPAEVQDRLTRAGRWIGLAFQVIDDILDIVATSEQLGKTAGKDHENDKMTYPAAMGLEASKATAKDMTDRALDELIPPDSFTPLRELALYMLHRTF